VADKRDIGSVLAAARAGKWDPVTVLVGPERFLADRAVRLLKKASAGDGPPGFNDDVFHGSNVVAQRVIAAAKTLPMMARARFVLIREGEDIPAKEHEALAGYVAAPSPTTCFVIVAEKLDGLSRLAKAAKSAGAWVECQPLKGRQLERFIADEATERGHSITPDAVSALVDAIGADLGALEDAVERLSLFVGPGKPIDLAAVEVAITRIRADTIWRLVDSVAARHTPAALAAADSLLATREKPAGILAMLARQVRLVARMKQALAEGRRADEAAQAAGVPAFKARELEAAARKFDDAALRRAFRLLAEADLALRGSKRPKEVLVIETVLALCEGRDLPLVSRRQLRV
jgi:DNA polymerase-3 subunit delta